MSAPHNPHLAVIGDREALDWVLTEEYIAFPEPRYRSQLRGFSEGDALYLYTTRGCFKNPTRDRGRLIGRATVIGPMITNSNPATFGGRSMPYEAPIRVEALTAAGTGVELGDLAGKLSCFPKPSNWSVYLRRSVVPLSEQDSKLLDSELVGIAGSRLEHLAGYQARARIGERR